MFIAAERRKRFALRQECDVTADMPEMSSAAARASINIALLRSARLMMVRGYKHCTPTECEPLAAMWLSTLHS